MGEVVSLVGYIKSRAVLGGSAESGSENAAPNFATAAFPGAVSVSLGKLRWYPSKTVTITSVRANADTVTSDITFDVKKNGVSITTVKPVVIAGQNRSEDITLSVTITVDDFLTVDVLSGNASDATVRIEYK